jgi:hypothetical protein
MIPCRTAAGRTPFARSALRPHAMLACLLCALASGAVRAQLPPGAAPAAGLTPERAGYAMDQPEILLRQRLFGRAHGLSLLAAACLDLQAYSKPVQDAYASWHVQQAKAIETIVRDLASYYFGSRADEAQWFDLSRALNLPDNIQPALGEVDLHAACASLPEAIPRQRYALDRLLAGATDAEPALGNPGAVPPAPTSQQSPE